MNIKEISFIYDVLIMFYFILIVNLLGVLWVYCVVKLKIIIIDLIFFYFN